MGSAEIIQQDAMPMSIDNCIFVNTITVKGNSSSMIFSMCKVPSAIVIHSTAQANPPTEYNTIVISDLGNLSVDDFIQTA